MAEVKGLVDEVKKGRLLALALLISVSLFIVKLSQSSPVASTSAVYFRAVLYFVLSYIGLLWALKFQVRAKGLMFVLTQSSFFIFSEVLFIELFFFRRFGRVYEALLLFFLLALMFGGTYISFLTANVFNVGNIKEIPLLQVGKTTSYILSLLMVYFVTFGLLESAFDPVTSFILIALFYIAIVFMHFRHLGIGKGSFWGRVVLTIAAMLILLIGNALTGSMHELVALVPMIAMFVMTGVVMHTERNQLSKLDIAQYVLLLIFSCGLNIYFS
jgi:hypothetical protein